MASSFRCLCSLCLSLPAADNPQGPNAECSPIHQRYPNLCKHPKAMLWDSKTVQQFVHCVALAPARPAKLLLVKHCAADRALVSAWRQGAVCMYLPPAIPSFNKLSRHLTNKSSCCPQHWTLSHSAARSPSTLQKDTPPTHSPRHEGQVPTDLSYIVSEAHNTRGRSDSLAQEL